MRWRGILLVTALAATLTGAALAAKGDPKKEYTKADQARAKAASLRLSDFAAGWKATPAGKGDKSHPRCSRYNPDQSDLVETGSYDSPDFTRSDNSFVAVSTSLFRTAKMAKTAYSRVARPALPACFGELLAKQTKASAVRVTFAGPLTFPHGGDRSNAYRLSATIASGTSKVPITVDFVLFNKGRYDIALIFFGVVRPLPASLQQQAAARVLSRVR